MLRSTAQNGKIDSLRTIIKDPAAVCKGQCNKDTLIAGAFILLGDEFQNIRPDSALILHQTAIEKAEAGLKKQKAGSFLQVFLDLQKGYAIRAGGWDNYLMGKMDESYDAFQEVFKIAEKYIGHPDTLLSLKAFKLKASAFSNTGTIFMARGTFPKALEYYNKALEISRSIGNKKTEAGVLGNIGIVYKLQGNFQEALNCYLKALDIAQKMRYTNAELVNLGNVGALYDILGNTEKALEYTYKALKLARKIGDKRNEAYNLSGIGIIYARQKEYAKALEYYQKALEIDQKMGNKNFIAVNLGNIGNVYNRLGNVEKSLEYLEKALEVHRETGNKPREATALISIGNVYFAEGDKQAKNEGLAKAIKDNYSKALDYYMQGIKIAKETDGKEDLASATGNVGSLYIKMRRYPEAKKFLSDYVKLSAEMKSLSNIRDGHQYYSEYYAATGKHREALEHYKLYVQYRDSLQSESNARELIQKEAQFNYEKKSAADSVANAKQQEIKNVEIARQDAEIKVQRNRQYALYGGIVLVLVFAGFMYNRFKITSRQKTIIEQKEKETSFQKQVIEEKHKEITDSINYAERIQRSFMATTGLLNQHLGDYFVYFRPKEAVSGDFYWGAELNNGKFAYVTADSTGHGVPGAIMSILNISALEKAVETETEAGPILGKTRQTIIERLQKDGSEEGGKDGMDCSLIVLDRQKNQLQYAAANNPVWIVRGNRMLELVPDKMPVGKHDKDKTMFSQHLVPLEKGDVIYTFTDGFADQFGGPKGKKFMYKPMKALLLSVAHLPMQEQRQRLMAVFTEWKATQEQIDDVCIIGVRV